MKSVAPRLFLAFVCSTVLGAPTASIAAKGDCGQPSSIGANPTVADALTILREALGQSTYCDEKPCVCDVNCDGEINTSDALLMLRRAVGQHIALMCCCEPPPPPGPACTSAVYEVTPGSELDYGWTGIARDTPLVTGTSIGLKVLSHCSDSGQPCLRDGDCASSDCRASCDCNDDNTCELEGPAGDKHCLTTLKDCTSNADCGGSVACVSVLAPPQPLSAGGTPLCMVNVFDGLVGGTANFDTGDVQLSVNLKSRWFLGITIEKPCPRCGEPQAYPRIGDQFTCDGGQFVGAACTVDGVSPVHGGTSYDCPPKLDAAKTGAGLALRLTQLTTGTTSRVAGLPCSDTSFRTNPTHPLNACLGGTTPGATCSTNTDCLMGGVCNVPECLDTYEPCTSNADCKRCTGDNRTICDANGDCSAVGGTCSEAPDQPVTCGFWCNCGFCNGNASMPCLGNVDCADGESCQVGPGTGNQQNVPQRKPNDCAQDNYVCGQDETESCAITPVGECSEQPYRSCTEGSATCENSSAGTCTITDRPCFEPRITRTGSASPLGEYCAFEDKTCSSNADCTSVPDDYCAFDSSRPETVALFCVSGTSGAGVNNVGGITGPAAIRLNGSLRLCRCGDGVVGCNEQCDDGNLAGGDGCDDLCRQE